MRITGVVTLLPVLYGWLLISYRDKIRFDKSKKLPSIPISLILYPIIGFTIMFLLWPYLWENTVNHIFEILTFYSQQHHIPVFYMGQMYFADTNLPWHYALVMLITTTPIPILFFASIGIVSALNDTWALKNRASSLVLLWLSVSLVRSSMPNVFPVYDGVRLFMEVIPALCILAGIGASKTYSLISTRLITRKRSVLPSSLFAVVLIGVIILPTFATMLRIHPYEACFYNELVGGIKSASRNFEVEYWGEAYKEGAYWLNRNARENATILVTVAPHIPGYYLRSDLHVIYRDSFSEDVDYVMFITRRGFYNQATWHCLNNFEPIYRVQVDNVDLLLIYKIR